MGTQLLRYLIPLLVVLLLIGGIWLAVGIGNNIGQTLTEWTVR